MPGNLHKSACLMKDVSMLTRLASPESHGPLTAAVDSADVKRSTWCSCLTLAVLQLSGQKQKPGSWCPATSCLASES